MKRTTGALDWSRWLWAWLQLPKVTKADGGFSDMAGAWSATSGDAAFAKVGRLEQSLRRDMRPMKQRDFGVGCPQEGRLRECRVADLARSASSDVRKGQWLMAATRYQSAHLERPLRILELGTCLGSGGDYLLSGGAEGTHYLGLEGSEELAQFTEKRLARHQEEGKEVRVAPGPFADTLSDVVSGPSVFDTVFLDGCHEGDALRAQWEALQSVVAGGALVVVDDIRWSGDMHAAWLDLSEQPGVAAYDLFRMGILVVGQNNTAYRGVRRTGWSQRA